MEKSLAHLHRFFSMDCAADMMGLKLFPNLKEVTESVGVFLFVKEHFMRFHEVPRTSNDVKLYVVGDGSTPRTAGMFAFLSKWDCHSVDPRLRIKSSYSKIKHLTLHNCKVEDLEPVDHPGDVVIVALHSHASAKATLEKIKGRRVFFCNVPCCVPVDITDPPYIRRVDKDMHTEKSVVYGYSY